MSKRESMPALLAPEASQLIERFRKHQLEQGQCRRYVETQVKELETFYRYLAWKHLSVVEMTAEGLLEFLKFVCLLSEMLHGRRPAKGTLYAWRVTLRHYYRWMKASGIVSQDPVRRAGVAEWRWVPKWVPSKELVERLLVLPDEYTYTGMRDQVIFALAATVGITNSELTGLTMDSLDLAGHRLKVRHGWRTRGQEERWVSLEPQIEKALERYLAYARPAWLKNSPTQSLFLTSQGRPITSNAISEIFITYSGRLGVKHLNCKALRNVAALYQLRHCGKTIEDLMVVFGYKEIKHVRGYMAYLPQELRKAVDRPRYPSLMQDLEFDGLDQSDRFAGLQELFTEKEAMRA